MTIRICRVCAAWLVAAVAACAPGAQPVAPANPVAPAQPAAAAKPAPPASPAAVAAPELHWFAISIAGEPVGREREAVEIAANGATTRTASEVRIGRLGKVVEIASDVTLDEDAAGGLRGAYVEVRLSRQVTTTDVAFAPTSATVRESAGGAVHTRTVALGEPLLGPVAIQHLLAAKLHQPGDAIDCMTWSPELSAPVRVHYSADARDPVMVDGAQVQALRVKRVSDQEGPAQTVWLDAAGQEVRSEVALPFGAMVSIATRSEPVVAARDMPSDVFSRTLLRSNVRLREPRTLDRLIVRLAFDGPADALTGLASADERVTAHDGSAVIEVDRVAVPPVSVAADSAPDQLAAGAIIDSDDPGVRAIAREAIAGERDAWARAQRLTRWVTEHMTFDAGIAFAPAPELARDRHGTCAGYAVLLASLLRAAGIPARLDIGVVYVNGVFGGHAWVEARVRGRWIPLDAAIPTDGPADAARIAFARSGLEQGSGPMIAALGRVMSHAKVTVLGYAHAGHAPVTLDATAPYTVDGGRYTNPGLGLSITAPAGYRFTDMDAVWPDRTVVALEGRGNRLTVTEGAVPPGRDGAQAAAEALALVGAAACGGGAIAGRRACSIYRDGAAGLAIADGSALLVLEAHGSEARALLDAVAAGTRLTAEQ